MFGSSQVFTPTPTPAPTTSLSSSPSPTPSVVPRAPIQLEVEGLGFLLSSIAGPLDEAGLEYQADVGAFISKTDGEDTGNLYASLGDFRGGPLAFSHRVNQLEDIVGFVANENRTVWEDDPYVNVAIQGHDESFSTRIYSTVEIIISSAAGSKKDSCIISGSSALCKVSIHIPDSWFLQGITDANITVTELEVDSVQDFSLGDVQLIARQNRTVGNSLFMRLPIHPLHSEEVIQIPIYAAHEFLLSSFSLDCTVDPRAKILNGNATETWSLLTSFYMNSTNRLSLTGFRNYDRFNFQSTELEPDLLANITLELPTVDSSSLEISIKCDSVEITLTTNEVLATMSSPGSVVAIDRDGVSADSGTLYVEPGRIIGILPYTEQNELVNTAILTRNRTEFDLNVMLYTSYGKTIPASTSTGSISCSSADESVIQVAVNCSVVYFDGSEQSGSNAVNIQILFGNLNASLTFIVWIPSLPLTLLPEDNTLNAISSSSCGTIYQRTRVSIMTNISTDSDHVQSVIISSIVYPYLKSSNLSVIDVNTETGEIRGVSQGTADVYVDQLEYNASVTILVTNELVKAMYLDLFAFTDIGITVPDPNVSLEVVSLDSIIANISLIQDFQFLNSFVNVVAVAVFADGHTMEIDETMENTNLEVRLGTERIFNGGFQVERELNDVSITATWLTNSTCLMSSGDDSIANGCTTINVGTADPIRIEISLTSASITTQNNPASLVGVPVSVILNVSLYYDEKSVDITSNNETQIYIIDEEVLMMLDRNTIVASRAAGTATVMAEYRNHTAQATIAILNATSLVLTANPYPNFNGSNSMSLTNLSKIGSSSLYQQARIRAFLVLSDGSERDVSNHTNTTVSATDCFGGLDQDTYTLSVNVTTENCTVEGRFGSTSDQILGSLELQVLANPVQVRAILEVFFTDFIAEFNTTRYADCAVLLSDGTQLSNTFDTGIPLYPNLINFFSEDDDIIRVGNESGSVTLLANSYRQVKLNAYVVENQSISCTAEFYCNLIPSVSEIDLGERMGPPLKPVEVGSNVTIAVNVNSTENVIGVYQLELAYDPDSVEFVDIEQGENWRNGSILHTDIVNTNGSIGKIEFGGVLNTGARTSTNLAHLADLTFFTNQTGVTNFSVTLTFLAEANLNVTVIPETETVSRSSQIQLDITSSSGRTTRSTEFEEQPLSIPPLDRSTKYHHKSHRVKRQQDLPLLGDVNDDEVADLRDVYLLQVYVASQVHNFTSNEGMFVQNTVGDSIDQLDFDGNSIITATELYTAERISFDIGYEVVNISRVQELSDNQCQLVVTGMVQTTNGIPAPVDNIRVFVDFSQSNETFQTDFNSTIFTVGTIVSFKDGITSFGGTVMAEVSHESRETVFVVQANTSSDFESSVFSVSIILVTVNDQKEVQDSRLSDLSSFDSLLAQRLVDNQSVNIPSQSVSLNVTNLCLPLQSSSSLFPTSTPTPSSIFTPASSTLIILSSSPELQSISIEVTTSLEERSTSFALPSMSLQPVATTLQTPVLSQQSSTVLTSISSPSVPQQQTSQQPSTALTPSSSSVPPQISTQPQQPSTVLTVRSSSVLLPQPSEVSSSVLLQTSTQSPQPSIVFTSTSFRSTVTLTSSSADVTLPRTSAETQPSTASIEAQVSATQLPTSTSIPGEVQVTTSFSIPGPGGIQPSSRAQTPVQAPMPSIIPGGMPSSIRAQTSVQAPMSSNRVIQPSSTSSEPGVSPTEPPKPPNGAVGAIVGGMVSIILILCLIIVIFLVVYCYKKSRRKGSYRTHSNRPTSRASKDYRYWFGEEEKVVSFVRLFVYLSICLFICLSVCLSVYLSVNAPLGAFMKLLSSWQCQHLRHSKKLFISL